MHITINQRDVEVPEGASVAAAAMAAGVATRQSVSGEARGPLCGMGICFECRATVNGVPHQRTCQVWAGNTMDPAAVPGATSAEVLVVGAGPAGLAAAATAAENGASVLLVDDNAGPGGQIWRGAATPAADWLARAQSAGVQWLPQTRVLEAPQPGSVLAEQAGRELRLEYQSIVIATGARERFLPFPGWTLPHVVGAGGLQALAKAGLPISGKRIVVAGTGPLLAAVAAYLKQHDARVVALCDQASAAQLARFGLCLPRGKWRDAARLARTLAPLGVQPSAWPLEALPGGVVLSLRGQRREVACDYLACGFHLVPNTELPRLLGCATQNGFVVVNARQQTSVAGVYCVGEPTGIGGLDLALAQGRVAGLAVTRGPLEKAQAEVRVLQPFINRLAAATTLRRELRTLVRPETWVCRCEDVPYARLAGQPNWRQAKLLTRCGMGACQGRVCGAACEYLFGWPVDPPRPPLFPAAVGSLGARL